MLNLGIGVADDNLGTIAAELRTRAGLAVPAYSTHKIIEACFPGALVTGRPLPDGIEEVVSQTAAGIVILYRRGLPIAAQRFAIAHAIGHLVFDMGAAAPLVDYEREYRADAFAAELLVPRADLEPLVRRYPCQDCTSVDHDIYLDQVDEIASLFVVPPTLIDRRIRDLGD